MSDKVVGKIFVTSWKNYKKFRDNENNRNLDERHVAKLVASFHKNGWDIEVGIETLEGIYNRRSAKKMYFSSAYREYLDNRNKKAERT